MPNGRCTNAAFCGREDVPLVGGLCSGCYSRLRRRGTLLPAYGRNGDTCEVEACDRRPFAKGMCSLHYQQAQHPLTMTWRLIRSRNPGAFPDAWRTLEGFIAEVGDRPSPKHQLRRIDDSLPWTAENSVWRAPVVVEGRTGVTADMAAYHRAWSYSRKFGLTEDDINEMRRATDEKCPICTLPFDRLNEKGAPVRTVLDHDHITGDVRGMICDPCNKGMGALGDDEDNCRRAADYLRDHARRKAGEANVLSDREAS